jgi:hypothetical protein
MFFMGVLGWPPPVVQDADINDLMDAYEGYMRFHGFLPPDMACPSKQFLSEMMDRFPDAAKG